MGVVGVMSRQAASRGEKLKGQRRRGMRLLLLLVEARKRASQGRGKGFSLAPSPPPHSLVPARIMREMSERATPQESEWSERWRHGTRNESAWQEASEWSDGAQLGLVSRLSVRSQH